MPDLIPTEGSDDIPALAAEANKLYSASSELYVNLKDKTKRLAEICAKFRELMDFSDTKFSMLAKIGLNQHLSTPEVEPYLTGNVSIDYVTASFKPELIDAGIQQGVIHLHTTRQEINKFKQVMGVAKKAKKGGGEALWTIRRNRALSKDETKQLFDTMGPIGSYGFAKVVTPENVAIISSTRKIKDEEMLWLKGVFKQISDLGFATIVDRTKLEARKRANKQDKAVRDAVAKALRDHPEARAKGCYASEVSELSYSLMGNVLASLGIDFDALKAKAQKTVPGGSG